MDSSTFNELHSDDLKKVVGGNGNSLCQKTDTFPNKKCPKEYSLVKPDRCCPSISIGWGPDNDDPE